MGVILAAARALIALLGSNIVIGAISTFLAFQSENIQMIALGTVHHLALLRNVVEEIARWASVVYLLHAVFLGRRVTR